MIYELIHKNFEEQVLKNPNLCAIKDNQGEITYSELNEKANQLAHYLTTLSVKNQIIGVLMNRTSHMLISILAVLKAGAAYLPIDPNFPEKRIQYILSSSGIKYLLTNEVLKEKSNDFTGKVIVSDVNELYTDRSMHNLEVEQKAEDLAYIIYTSGSTGNPKGVMIEHRSVVNFIEGVTSVIDFYAQKKILCLTTLSFDIFVLETLLPLSKGLTVVLAGDSSQKNPKKIVELILENNIEMIQMTPSMMQMIISNSNDLLWLKNLKEIMIGAEAFPQRLLDVLKANTSAKIYNMYGPTETTIWSTIADLTEESKITIGKPILNTQVYIVDKESTPLPYGIEGELCIGGTGVARGYLNNESLTLEKFFTKPSIGQGRLYKTGDIARILPNGNIQCLGRMDNQVKVRGHRIELEDIEANILNFHGVKGAVVKLIENDNEENFLCAYIVPEYKFEDKELMNFLQGEIPEYMLPACILRLSSLPQTPNGKIDRQSLPKPEKLIHIEDGEEDDYTCEVEQKIIAILKKHLPMNISREVIKESSNLSFIGLTSILFIKIIVEIECEFAFEFYDDDLNLNKYETLDSLVNYVKSRI